MTRPPAGMRIDFESIGIDPVRLRLVLMNIVKIFGLVFIGIVTSAPPRSFAAEQASDVPTWLGAHVGEGEGQIAQVVLQRARALYFQKVREGVVRNPCHFAMVESGLLLSNVATGPSGESTHKFHKVYKIGQIQKTMPTREMNAPLRTSPYRSTRPNLTRCRPAAE